MRKLNKIKHKVNEWMSYKLNCSGVLSYVDRIGFVQDESGLSAIECLYYYESRGEVISCNELKVLETYLQAKGALDLQIKIWAEDRAKGWLGLNDFKNIKSEIGMSEWVFNAVENQKVKLYLNVSTGI